MVAETNQKQGCIRLSYYRIFPNREKGIFIYGACLANMVNLNCSCILVLVSMLNILYLFCTFSPPTTRRRTRDHRDTHQMSGTSRHSESPERRAFQPPHIPTRQIHPAAMLPQPHPIVLDVEQVCTCTYRIILNKGAPYSLAKAKSTKNDKSLHNFLNNCPIFNPKPPLESSEPQLQSCVITFKLVRAPAPLLGIIR